MNSLLDSVGEGEGGMFQENRIETCILSRVKQIASPGWMHETSARAGALGRLRGIGWRGRWEGGSGWRIHVNPWLIHVNVWQKPLQYCKVISLQLIKINGKKKKEAWLTQYIYNLLKTVILWLKVFWNIIPRLIFIKLWVLMLLTFVIISGGSFNT